MFSPPSEDSSVAGVMVLRSYGERVDILAHVGNSDERYQEAWLPDSETLLAFDLKDDLDTGKAIARAMLFEESPERLAFQVSREMRDWETKVNGKLLAGCEVCLICKMRRSQLYHREGQDLVCEPCEDTYLELMGNE